MFRVKAVHGSEGLDKLCSESLRCRFPLLRRPARPDEGKDVSTDEPVADGRDMVACKRVQIVQERPDGGSRVTAELLEDGVDLSSIDVGRGGR